MTPPASRTLIVSCFVLLTLIWGTTWAAIRLGLEGIPPLTGVALRFAIAAVALGSLAPWLGVRFNGGLREKVLWVVNAVCGFSASYGLVYWGEQWVPSSLAAVLFAAFPLFVALWAQFLLPAERMNARKAAGLVVGFAGLVTIFSEDLSSLGGPGVAMGAVGLLVAPMVSSFSSVAIKRYGSDLHPISLTAVPMGLTAGIMGALALTFERDRTLIWDVQSVSALVYLAIMGSAVTFYLYYWLLARIPATSVATIAYTTPLIAVAIGLLLDEPMTLRIAAGAALVLGGVALTVSKRRAKASTMADGT